MFFLLFVSSFFCILKVLVITIFIDQTFQSCTYSDQFLSMISTEKEEENEKKNEKQDVDKISFNELLLLNIEETNHLLTEQKSIAFEALASIVQLVNYSQFKKILFAKSCSYYINNVLLKYFEKTSILNILLYISIKILFILY